MNNTDKIVPHTSAVASQHCVATSHYYMVRTHTHAHTHTPRKFCPVIRCFRARENISQSRNSISCVCLRASVRRTPQLSVPVTDCCWLPSFVVLGRASHLSIYKPLKFHQEHYVGLFPPRLTRSGLPAQLNERSGRSSWQLRLANYLQLRAAVESPVKYFFWKWNYNRHRIIIFLYIYMFNFKISY